jgi:hypothetical protein
MTWAHRDPDANTLKWLASHQYSDEFGDAAVEHNVNLRAVTNDATVQTIAARVEAFDRKRALPPPEVEDAEVVEQEGDADSPRMWLDVARFGQNWTPVSNCSASIPIPPVSNGAWFGCFCGASPLTTSTEARSSGPRELDPGL